MRTQAHQSDEASEIPAPAVENEADLYEVLQVSPKAEAEVIEAAYRRLAFKYHPDRNPGTDATLRMQELNAAYMVLSSLQLRAEYDRTRQGLPPLEDAAATDRETAPPPAPKEAKAGYNWDDLPFAAPNSGIINPRRGWLRLKVLLHRHRRQLLPYSLIFVLALVLGILLLFQNTVEGSSGKGAATVATLLPTSSLTESFEDTAQVAQDWTLDAPWHLTNRLAASGSTSLWVGNEQTRTYTTDLDVSATLNRPLDLTQAPHPMLFFKINGQFDNEASPSGRDRLFVEVAQPGHDFETVFSISNTFNTWQPTQVDLSRWRGQTILIRFRFQSGSPAPGYTGPFLDDIIVSE